MGSLIFFLNKLETMIQKLLRRNKAIILCGDWNIDMLHENSNQKDLVGLLQRYNLVNTVHSPTRITNSTSSLLDLMLINEMRFEGPASIYELGLSDHLAQILSVTCSIPAYTPIKKWRRNFNENNINKFIDLLKQTTWQGVISLPDVNAKLEMFTCKISTLFDIAFPLRQIYIRKTTNVTWITQGIRISSKKVRLFNLIKKRMTLSMGATLYIAKYKSIYKRVINEAKRRKNDRILIQANNKPKAIWKIIKDEVGRSSTITHDIILDTQTNEIGDLNKIVDLFNVYFCETPVKLLKNNKLNNISPSDKHSVYIKGCNKSIFFTPVTENEVVEVAKSLKNKFATGNDDIPDYIVKQCIDYLKKPLTDIYNASLESGIFPDQLKIAKVIPVHKKGNKRDINNYRPIAPLSVFSRLLKKLVYNRITTFIDRNGILADAQHGFRSKRSGDSVPGFY